MKCIEEMMYSVSLSFLIRKREKNTKTVTEELSVNSTANETERLIVSDSQK